MSSLTPISSGHFLVDPQGQLFLRQDPSTSEAAIDVEHFADRIASIVARSIKQQPLDDWITAQQVAELFNCSIATVNRLTRDKIIPSVKFGHLRRYSRSKLLALGESADSASPCKPR